VLRARGLAALCAVLVFAVAGCDRGAADNRPSAAASSPLQQGVWPSVAAASAVPKQTTTHARHFRLIEGAGYQVLEMQAAPGGNTDKARAERRFVAVLVPRSAPLPALPETLRDAVVVRTPVERFAVTTSGDERMLTELGLAQRLVAVGGTKSYDDRIRERVLRKDLAQVGYSWHSPPNLDVLLASKPDVFLLRLWSLELATSLERANRLGVPTLPILMDAEPTALARAEWIKVFGALAGELPAAQARFAEIEAAYRQWQQRAAAEPPKAALWAYFDGAQRWVVTVRGPEAGLLRDAGARVVLGEPDALGADDVRKVGTETLLTVADQPDCWIAGDIHARQLPDERTLAAFKAYRQGCFFGNFGRSKPQWDAFDWYETGVVRPDLVLRDLVKMLHPTLVTEPFEFLQPITREAAGGKPR
jgi:ABC-type Fe3+-hydroxamate transport system substrate-binding protein